MCSLSVLASLVLIIENRFIPALSALSPRPASQWPSISFIIPACNEEETVREALMTFRDLDYPNYEIVAINDRSTDDTGRILDDLKSQIPMLRVVHNDHLPEQWLGKVHAMHLGTQQATGDFLVYIDADVHLSPDALKKVMSLAVEKELDHLTILPGTRKGTYGLECLLSAFAGFFVLLTGAGAVNRGNRKKYVGAGAFMMVRRSLFDKTEGWPWLSLEIADDVGLAYMMNRHGAKSFVLQGKNDLKLEWYPDVPGMIQGLEKNVFAVVCRFSVLRACTIVAAVSLYWLSPIIALFTSAWPFGVMVLFTNVLTALLGPRMTDKRLPSIFGWFCIPILIYIVIRSSLFTTRQQGIIWRGTHYPMDQLRKGQRVKL